MATASDGKMGFWMATALVVGSVIGVSVFMLPVALAPLGMNAVVGWLISAVGAVCLGLPLARLARGGEGIQSAVENTFGPTVGFVVTWAFWVSNWSGVAAIAVGAASAISRIIPALANPMSVVLVSVALIAISVPINARGARASGSMAIVTVLLRVLPLIAVVIIAAAKAASRESLQPLWTQPLTVPAIATATALTLFAFTGFENVTAPVGKVRDSERTIPRALLIGVMSVALLYLASSTSVMLLLPADQLAHSASPFADVVGASLGEIAAYVVAAGIAVSAFGCIGCTTMAGGELCYSMAAKRDLPKALGWTNRNQAPLWGQVVSAGLAILLVLSNASRSTAGLFTFILLVSTVAVLILYVVAALATWVREPAPGIRALVFAGIIFGAFAFYGSGLEASLWGVGLAAAGLVVRAISRWRGGSSLAEVAIPAAPPESFS